MIAPALAHVIKHAQFVACINSAHQNKPTHFGNPLENKPIVALISMHFPRHSKSRRSLLHLQILLPLGSPQAVDLNYYESSVGHA
jgi:hypothetical protein